jgi:hypothetical protein
MARGGTPVTPHARIMLFGGPVDQPSAEYAADVQMESGLHVPAVN